MSFKDGEGGRGIQNLKFNRNNLKEKKEKKTHSYYGKKRRKRAGNQQRQQEQERKKGNQKTDSETEEYNQLTERSEFVT